MSTTNPIAAVRQYIDAFNKDDGEAMAASFAVPGRFLTACRHTAGWDQRLRRIGIAMC